MDCSSVVNDYITLIVGYRSDVIKEHFGNGVKFGSNIDYITEYSPLGTDGALALTIVANLNGAVPLRASERHSLDLSQSYIIGDSNRDINAGQAAGYKAILVDDNYTLLDAIEQTIWTRDCL